LDRNDKSDSVVYKTVSHVPHFPHLVTCISQDAFEKNRKKAKNRTGTTRLAPDRTKTPPMNTEIKTTVNLTVSNKHDNQFMGVRKIEDSCNSKENVLLRLTEFIAWT
jgi:hypothetical protein